MKAQQSLREIRAHHRRLQRYGLSWQTALQAGASVALFARNPEKLEVLKSCADPSAEVHNQRIHNHRG